MAFELRVPGGSLVALTQQPVVHVPRAPPPAKPDENDENRRDCSSDHDGLAEGDALVQCEGVLDRGVDERELALEPAARVCDASDDSKEEDSDEPVCERRVRQPSRDLGWTVRINNAASGPRRGGEPPLPPSDAERVESVELTWQVREEKRKASL